MKKVVWFMLLLPIAAGLHAQKDITLEGIWKDYEYVAKSVPGFNLLNDGKHYTRL